MAEKKVEWDIITGHPDTILNKLRRRLDTNIHYYEYIKVGITGRNPQVRFDEHLRDINWERMIVIYETSSEVFANHIEDVLVKEYKDCLVNEIRGGGDDLAEEGNNYVYVLLAIRK